MVKNLPAVWETWVLSLGCEDPLGEGNGYPLQYSGLENSMDRGAWQTAVYGVANGWTQLSDPHFFINAIYININIVYKYTVFQTLILQRNCQG